MTRISSVEPGCPCSTAARDRVTFDGEPMLVERAGGTGPRDRSFAPLLVGMGLFVVAGAPMTYYLWTVLNDMLAGRFPLGRIALAVPVLAIFLGLLAFLARTVQRWDVAGSDR